MLDNYLSELAAELQEIAACEDAEESRMKARHCLDLLESVRGLVGDADEDEWY
ncbi:hypothetical protein [Atopococcus tabaci]|uniref:hypothetical protein n=1 Tax=Atopococcus tabaci TaxID=269774 RepID=UPI0003FA3044|nr:hypothetical protein [Atopococcus tabaci]